MDQDRIFIHRANSVNSKADPFTRLQDFKERGFRNLEIDVTVVGTDSYKFCHPTMLNNTSTEYSFSSSFFDELATLGDVLWLIDIKYLDVDMLPMKLVERIHATLGERVIFSAALPQLLSTAQNVGARTAQFFRSDIRVDQSIAVDYFIQKNSESLSHPLDKTIVYCKSMSEVEEYIARGVAFGMIDNENLSVQKPRVSQPQ